MSQRERLTIPDRVSNELNERFRKKVNVNFQSSPDGAIISQGIRDTINSYDYDREVVKATPWFNDAYWFFIRIRFAYDLKKTIRPFVSVSFFQEAGDTLKQLFRAEWDSYPQEEGYNHPQPHWHFTAQLSDKTSFSEFENEEEEGVFSKLAGNAKTINLDRMHFAMSGGWPSDGEMRNDMSDEIKLVDWLLNLFFHVRKELEYKEERSGE